MRNFRRFRIAPLVFVCLGFTGARVAWADSAHQSDLYVEDPYAPHNTDGSEARLGTIVGFVHEQTADVLALGVTAAIGQRFGRLTIESEYSYFNLQTRGTVMTAVGPGDGDISLGRGQRLGVLARFDVIRIGPRVVGPNSLLSFFVEGGAASAWNHWSRPAANEAGRIVPNDTNRAEGQVGFGVMLDHRLQEPIGFPHRIAWFLGWRVAMSPHEPMTASVCRGVSCRAVPMADDNSLVDRSMMFQSSLAFTF